MDVEEFVKKVIRSNVLDANATYAEYLKLELDDVSDDYWSSVISLHASLDAAGQKVIRQIMLQVTVETIAQLFAVLDGDHVLDDRRYEFSVKSLDDGSELAGYLLEEFYSEWQEER